MILRRISLLVNGCEEPEYIAPIAKNLTYNGSSQELLTAGSTNDGTIYYSIDNSTWNTTVPSGTNADSYTVYWKLVGDKGWCNVEPITINVTIAKADATYTAPTAKSLTYNGSAQALLNAGAVTGGTIQYSDDNITWGTSIPTGTNANTYTSYWRIVGDSNHNDKASASISTTIAKVTPTVVAPTAKVLTYNGSAQSLVNAGSTDYGTLKYSTDGSSYSTSIPSGTNATSYTVYYKVDGDSNINSVTAKTVSASIAKADSTYTAPTANNLIYNGSAQALLNAGAVTGGTIYYSSDNSTWSTTIPTGTNANTYTSYWKITGDSNHNDKSSASISTTISPKTVSSPTITLSPSSYIYNASACQPTPTVKDGSITISSSEYTVSYSDNINAGTATCTITDKSGGNYTVSGSKTFTINKANSSLSFAVTDMIVVVGEVSSNVVTVNAGDGTVTYSSNNASAVTVDNNGSITGVSAGNATITANISSTSNYNSASTSYTSSCVEVITAKFNVTSTSNPTRIASATTNFAAIEIDGVKQSSVTTGYTFDTVGEHTVKYTLTDPTSIGSYAFYKCSGLTSIDIPSGVTSISDSAFRECSGLTSISISSGVTSIGDNAFYNCIDFTSCTIGSGVTSIGASAFIYCSNLKTIISRATMRPAIKSTTFQSVGTDGTLYVPIGSSGYDVWMGTGSYYLGYYNWTKVEMPSGYKICEYIGNQGAAYIDTNITLDFTETIKIKISVSDYKTQWGGILGNYKNEDSNCTRIIQNNSNPNKAIVYFNNKAKGGGKSIDINGLDQINTYEISSSSVIVNGTNTGAPSSTQGDSFNASINLFTNNPNYAIVDGKLYSFSISGKCNMIPCISPSNVVGLYDTVRNQFFSSANSTALVAGPVIGQL